MDKLNFTACLAIDKGWSDDKKYQVTDQEGKKYLLRLSSQETLDRKRKWFAWMQKVATLNLPICQFVQYGICEEGVYTLHDWIEGEDVQERLGQLSKTRQVELGYESGRILKQIHTLSAHNELERWDSRFNRKMDRNIRLYQESVLSIKGEEKILSYCDKNRNLLLGRPQCFQHGDYHIGNMMLEKDKLVIIDFDRFDFGDPWEEFNRIVWSAQACPLFAKGQIKGYFQGEPPMQFFQLLKLYIFSNSLSSAVWAQRFGKESIDKMMMQVQEVLSWYQNTENPVPSWYYETEENEV